MQFIRAFVGVAFLSACSPQLEPGDDLLGQRESANSALPGGVAFGLGGQLGNRQFKLARATLEVSGSASVILRAPRDVIGETLSAPLPAGAYATYLRPGFELHELLPDGTEHKVDAALIGKNPRVTRIVEGRAEPQTLTFRVDGASVVVGGGPDLRSAAVLDQP